MKAVLKAIRESESSVKSTTFRLILDNDNWLHNEYGYCGYAVKLHSMGRLTYYRSNYFAPQPAPSHLTYDNLFPVEWGYVATQMQLESGEQLIYLSYDYGPGWKRWFVCTERNVPIIDDVEHHIETLYSVILAFENESEAVRFKLTVG